MARILISYRRADTEGYAGRVYDHLVQHFDKTQIFRDVDTIKPGRDFVKLIEEVVGSCDALIAVIGPRWLDIRNEKGMRRLDEPHDLVRLEIATALKRNTLVIPVLVERARMPGKNELPDDLSALTRRNAIELSDERFSYDLDRLVQAIGGAYGSIGIGLGSFYSSLIRARVMNPLEVFEIHVDRKWVGTIEGPGFGLLKGESEKKSWNPITVRVEEGVHKIHVISRRSERGPKTRSNELAFRMKGGQSMTFTIERESPPSPQSKLVIKPCEPIVDP